MQKDTERDFLSDILLASTVEVTDPGDAFNKSVLSRSTADDFRRALRYWTPTLGAAAAVSIGLLAAIQLSLTDVPAPLQFQPGSSEAKLEYQSLPVIPESLESNVPQR